MKKEYLKPVCDQVEFRVTDILVASGGSEVKGKFRSTCSIESAYNTNSTNQKHLINQLMKAR